MKLFKSLLLAFILFLIITPSSDAATKFKDVPNSMSSASSIYKMVELGLVGGYPDGTFLPKKSISKAEFASIYSKFTNGGFPIESARKQRYTDILLTHWAASPIEFIAQRTLMWGSGAAAFNPNQALTRGEFAFSLMQYYKYEVPDSFTINFTDVPKNHPQYNAIRALVYNKITSGTSATTFSPSSPLTREQIAIFLDRTGRVDDGLRMMKVEDFSAFYTKGDATLPFSKFEEMDSKSRPRLLWLSPFNSMDTPNYVVDPVLQRFVFEQRPGIDGEHFYLLTYHGWGVFNQEYKLLKVIFKNSKPVEFKLYSKEEFEKLKQTELASAYALSNYLAQFDKNAHGTYDISYSSQQSISYFPSNFDNFLLLLFQFPKTGEYIISNKAANEKIKLNVTKVGQFPTYTFEPIKPIDIIKVPALKNGTYKGYSLNLGNISRDGIEFEVAADEIIVVSTSHTMDQLKGIKIGISYSPNSNPSQTLRLFYQFDGNRFNEITESQYLTRE